MSEDPFKSLGELSDGEGISLGRLSQLTGFPEDFIKKELLLEDDVLSLSTLRKNATRYLNGIYGVEADQ